MAFKVTRYSKPHFYCLHPLYCLLSSSLIHQSKYILSHTTCLMTGLSFPSFQPPLELYSLSLKSLEQPVETPDSEFWCLLRSPQASTFQKSWIGHINVSQICWGTASERALLIGRFLRIFCMFDFPV